MRANSTTHLEVVDSGVKLEQPNLRIQPGHAVAAPSPGRELPGESAFLIVARVLDVPRLSVSEGAARRRLCLEELEAVLGQPVEAVVAVVLVVVGSR